MTRTISIQLALFARPEAIRGLQVASRSIGLLAPINSPRIGETILAAHAVFVRPRFEWLNEAWLFVTHLWTSKYLTPGFYTQFSRQLAPTALFPLPYINASARSQCSRRSFAARPLCGLRYDASESVALKLQYDYTDSRARAARNALACKSGLLFRRAWYARRVGILPVFIGAGFLAVALSFASDLRPLSVGTTTASDRTWQLSSTSLTRLRISPWPNYGIFSLVSAVTGRMGAESPWL